MLHHSESNIAGFSLLQEVFAPHQALKFRELTHHLADQIVLAEMSGTLGRIHHALIQTELLQQQARKPLDSLGAVQKTSQAFGEGDTVEGFTPGFAGLTPVNIEEKFGIRQASSKHAFIAANNQGRRRGQAIAHQKELGPKHSLSGESERISLQTRHLQRHITLVGLHHRADHLRRKLQEPLSNGSLENPGVFNQVHQFLKQRLRTVGSSVGGLCRLVQAGANSFGPLRTIDNNASGGKGLSKLLR